MKEYVLKSLLGKYVCLRCCVKYCHVDEVMSIDGNKAIVTVIVNTHENKTLHWITDVEWETDKAGIHKIIKIRVLKEDEMNGYAEKDKVI